MIAPNGNIKRQIKQSDFVNQSIWDGDLFGSVDPETLKKMAIINPIEDKTQPNNELAGAMNSGQMRGNNVPNNPELKKDVGNMSGRMDGAMPSARGIGQSNNEMLSPFLSPDGTNEDDSELIGLQQEKIKLRQAAGKGFAINLRRSKEGAFEVIVIPPKGYTIPQPDEFASALMKAVQGVADEIGDPDPNTGAMKIVYKSRLGGGPQKIMKGNKK